MKSVRSGVSVDILLVTKTTRETVFFLQEQIKDDFGNGQLLYIKTTPSTRPWAVPSNADQNLLEIYQTSSLLLFKFILPSFQYVLTILKSICISIIIAGSPHKAFNLSQSPLYTSFWCNHLFYCFLILDLIKLHTVLIFFKHNDVHT